MKVLVIGSGGREHALVWKIAQSTHVSALWCAPANAGIAQERLAKNSAAVQCVPLAAEDFPGLLSFARENKIDLTVVGPDAPLAMGIVDLFQKNGLRAFGPNQKAARFESSKVFSQSFMKKYGLPVAAGACFSAVAEAKRFAASLGGHCVVKADGLALGKGVLICQTQTEAEKAIDAIMLEKAFGDSGSQVVVQEFLEGMEISLHALCDGKTARLFPTSQDHKRAFEDDKGLNTGGMGTYSPTPFLSETELAAVGSKILEPWLRGCREEGIDFRGLLYPGVMLTKSGPKLLEFNARFGDPETQVYMPLLQSDLYELIDACVEGTLDKTQLRWSTQTAVCVIMASSGYPGAYTKGKLITGFEAVAALPDTKVFHAGTRRAESGIATNGGRVLGVTAWGNNLISAREAAYVAAGKIHFDGAFYRRDLGAKALKVTASTKA